MLTAAVSPRHPDRVRHLVGFWLHGGAVQARLARLFSLFLAVFLQLIPFARGVMIHPPGAMSGWVLMIRWLGVGTGLMAAGHQAVSGASATIVSPLTAKATNGIPFKYRIVTSPYVATAFLVTPLPPAIAIPQGLVLEANPTGIIDGTPREEGTWSIQLTASEAGFADRTTYATLVLTVVPNPNQPPAITSQPKSVSVTNGASVLLSVSASRVGALGYQWQFNGTPIAGANFAALSFPSIDLTNAGEYRVIAKNNYGSVTSAVATVTVTAPVRTPLVLGPASVAGTNLVFQVSGPIVGSYVISSSADLLQWTPILTNTPSQGVIQFQEALDTARGVRFYRAALGN